MPPKVSVIIPVYGVEKYIERCARSLFEQTLDSIEYLFINDCTPDKSIDILKNVLDEYPNRETQVRIINMPHNSGQAKVREVGIKSATGEYIIHCDSDDWVDKDMYRAMYEKAKQENADLVYCDYFTTDGQTKKDKKENKKNICDKEYIIEQILEGKIHGGLWRLMSARSLYTQNDIHYPTINMCEDVALNLQLIYHSKRKIIWLNNTYYYYFQNNVNAITKQRNISIQRLVKQQYIELIDWLKSTDFKKKDLFILLLKLQTRLYLNPFLKQIEIYKEWWHTYPEITGHIVPNKFIPAKIKIRYLLGLTRLYPALWKSD